ncbi:MAG: hypothetical protein CM15mP120_28200 [Pseudomonadota bacterium]|nr:MAG: hypothetical protein CM15mP120_28200 [Pseudomonadota bacterium]
MLPSPRVGWLGVIVLIGVLRVMPLRCFYLGCVLALAPWGRCFVVRDITNNATQQQMRLYLAYGNNHWPAQYPTQTQGLCADDWKF